MGTNQTSSFDVFSWDSTIQVTKNDIFAAKKVMLMGF